MPDRFTLCALHCAALRVLPRSRGEVRLDIEREIIQRWAGGMRAGIGCQFEGGKDIEDSTCDR